MFRRGLKVDRQKPVDIEFNGVLHTAAFRIDIVVGDTLVIEVKAVDALNNAHLKQVLTYLRLTSRPVGLISNFSGATMKEGIRRVVNQYRQPQALSASPRLRVKSSQGDR